MSCKLHYGDMHLAIASWQNVQMQFFTGPLLAGHCPAVMQARDDIAGRYPGKRIYALTWILPTVNVPDRTARAAAGGMLSYIGRTGGASAYVIEGTGLRATTMRTFISVMLMAAHTVHPTRVLDRTSDAAQWLVEEAMVRDSVLSLAGLQEAVETVRQQHLGALAQRVAS